MVGYQGDNPEGNYMRDGFRLIPVPDGFFAVPNPVAGAVAIADKQADAMEMIGEIVKGILAGEGETELRDRCDPEQWQFLYPAAMACIPAVQSFVEDFYNVSMEEVK